MIPELAHAHPLLQNPAFEMIPCPVCGREEFNPVFHIAPRKFIHPSRLDTYNLQAIGCDLDTLFTYQRCAHCGYTGTNPRLRKGFDNIVYNEMKSDLGPMKGWAFEDTDLGMLYRTHHKWFAINLLELTLGFFQERFSKRRNEGYAQLRLLDIGCGYGHILELATVFGIDAFGVEIDESRIEYCHSLGLKVFEPNKLPPGKFDIIISTSVIEHAFDLAEYFSLVTSRLSPNGIFAFTGLTPEIIKVETRSGVYKNVAPIEHLNLVPKSALYKLAASHGLRPVPFSRFWKALKASAHISPRFFKYLFQRTIRFDFWRGSFMEIMVKANPTG